MNGWTKKRKVDIFMGIFLQVYCFFPWMRINEKWNTIHMYVIKTFQENDYIKMYNHTFLKQHMWEWKHSQVVAFIFLLMLIFLILIQSIELYDFLIYRQKPGTLRQNSTKQSLKNGISRCSR